MQIWKRKYGENFAFKISFNVQGVFLDRQILAKLYEIMIKANKGKEVFNDVKGVA